jgi:hypothetical protein
MRMMLIRNFHYKAMYMTVKLRQCYEDRTKI